MPTNDSKTAGSLPPLTVLKDKAGPHTIGAVSFTLGLSFNQATEALHRIETWTQVVEALEGMLKAYPQTIGGTGQVEARDRARGVIDSLSTVKQSLTVPAAERKG